MITFIGIFVGGGLGSLLRWLCCNLIQTHWGTMLVNIIGAFFIGVAYAFFSKMASLPSELKLFIITGLLGGFTTFSTYLLNFITLINSHNLVEAFIYLFCSILFGSLFLVAGIRLVD